jgi:hypothetical protein
VATTAGKENPIAGGVGIVIGLAGLGTAGFDIYDEHLLNNEYDEFLKDINEDLAELIQDQKALATCLSKNGGDGSH